MSKKSIFKELAQYLIAEKNQKMKNFIGKPSQLMVTYHNAEEIYVGGKIIEHKKLC